MPLPLTLEIHRPELASLLRERMSQRDFDVEECIAGALRLHQFLAGDAGAPAGKLASSASNAALYAEQAKVVDLAVAVKKSSFETKKGIVIAMAVSKFTDYGTYGMAAYLGRELFGISVQPNVLRDYWKLLKSPNKDAEINAFLKRASETHELRDKLVAASINYDELARVAAAQGLKRTAAELEKYLASWNFLSATMKAMLERGAITPQQFKERAGYPIEDLGMTGLGKDMDLVLMGGVLSAIGWGNKLMGAGNAKIPMAAIIFPATAVMMGGLDGQTFTFKELGNMFAESIRLALEGMVVALDELHNTFSSFFG